MIPDIVKVGPYVYTVRADRNAINMAARASQQDRTGEINMDKQTITLDPDLAPDMLAETLLHEVMHAIQDAVGIDSKEKIVSHEMIYRTGPTLLATLRENPDLVAFLLRETT